MSVGDVSVSCGGNTELCGVDTVLSGAVSGGLCYLDSVSGGGDTDVSGAATGVACAVSKWLCELDRVPGGGDTDVSGVNTVLSGAVTGCLCNLDSVSRGDIVVRIGEMSLSGGRDAVIWGVHEYVCGVNSVMSADIFDLCDIDTAVSGVELDVCGCNSLVSDLTGCVR